MKYLKFYIAYLIFLVTPLIFYSCSVQEEYYPDGAITTLDNLIQEFK